MSRADLLYRNQTNAQVLYDWLIWTDYLDFHFNAERYFIITDGKSNFILAYHGFGNESELGPYELTIDALPPVLINVRWGESNHGLAKASSVDLTGISR